jgi:hypothetical protein
MSSSYRRICLAHEPPLVIDDTTCTDTVPPVQHVDHPDCPTGLARWSGGLIELWLPIVHYYPGPDGKEPGRWYDVGWMSRYPRLAARVLAGGL